MAVLGVRIDTAARAKTISRLLIVLSLTVYVATAGGSLTTTDAVATFDVTRSIVERHSVAMSSNLLGREAERGLDGRFYSPFGLGQSIYNVPFYLAAKFALRAPGMQLGKPDTLPKAFVSLGQTLISVAVVFEIFRLSLLVTGNVAASALAAVTLAFGSVLWPYSKFGFNQPLACLTLVSAVRCAFVGVRAPSPKHLVWSGCWLASSLMTRHEMAIAALPVAVWIFLDGEPSSRERIRRIGAFSPGLGLGIGAWLLYNAIRFGNPLETGYLHDATPGFGNSIATGLFALVASPAASVFLYSPFAIAGVAGLVMLTRRDRSAGVLMWALVLAFMLAYASLGNWLGGRSYGSRYLVVVLPYLGVGWAAMLAEMSDRARRVAFACVFLVGMIVQLPGVLVDYAKISQEASAGGVYTTEARQWDWPASGLVLNTRAVIRAVPENASYLLARRTPPSVRSAASADDRSFSQQFSFSLDFWWLYLFYMGKLPAIAVFSLALAFAAIGGMLAVQLAHEIRHTG
jgi:hypothetical protein